MTPDSRDTIAAIATAHGRGARGVVRMAGPESLAIAAKLIGGVIEVKNPQLLADKLLQVKIGEALRSVACDLLVWPDERSYTRQPAVEIHTIGSPPVLEAILAACLTGGARLAEPGEFTLRAFLAGRIDLLQAEAVLAVIDARQVATLEPALAQLAGGLSGPLHRLRDELLDLLADLEAGLDFVEEEDVRFIEPQELLRRIEAAAVIVAEAEQQTRDRGEATHHPRIVIVGPPNVGKSRLFNVLVERFGKEEDQPTALVANEPGVTRDALSAIVCFGGFECELVDTAGDDESIPLDAIDQTARDRVPAVRAMSDITLVCSPATAYRLAPDEVPAETLTVITMADLVETTDELQGLRTSAATGEGIDELSEQISKVLDRLENEGTAGAVAHTAARCRQSLAEASERLQQAALLAVASAGEELVSLELRSAIDAVGRVVGEVVTEDVLGLIFGKFCIGK